MQGLFLYLSAMILSGLSGYIFIPFITRFCLRKRIFDIPDARKIHKNPIPRLGGITFVPGMLLATLLVLFIMGSQSGSGLTLSLWSLGFCLSLLIVYITGFVDDLVGLSATPKFIIELIAASTIPLSGLYINNLYGLFGIYAIPYAIGAPLTVFILVFACNAINLIDGIDGLAASLTIVALMGFLILYNGEDLLFYCTLIAALIGVLLPYLYYNMFGSIEKREKIFMGDSGSLSLGFILGFLAVKYCMDTPRLPFDGNRFMWSWTLLAVPCFDVVRVFFYRLCHHHSPFHPDKNHIHHKLMTCGLSQHAALAVILLLQVLLIAINVLLSNAVALTLTLIINIAIYIIFITTVDIITDRKKVPAANPRQIA